MYSHVVCADVHRYSIHTTVHQHSLLHTGSFSLNCSADTVESALTEAKQLLYIARQHRVPPMLDDKVITAWNGLMISAYAKAAQAFANDSYALQAHTAALFIHDNLYDGDTLYRSWRYKHVHVLELAYFKKMQFNLLLSLALKRYSHQCVHIV
jgi:uncharacterized protein